MSVVHDLVLLHLGATSVLLVLFTAVIVCQRAADLLRERRLARRPLVEAYPDPAHTGGASVLHWTVDLRDPARAEGAPVLQKTS